MTARKPSKLDVALWLLARPGYWPDLGRRVRVNVARSLLPPPLGRSAEVATRWAARVAVDPRDVGFLAPTLHRRLQDDFPAEMAAALALEERFPTQKGWGGSADLIYAVAEAIAARTVIETGVAHGFSSLALLLSVARRGGHVYSIDMPAIAVRDPTEVGVVVPDRLRGHWTLFRYPDSVGLGRALAAATSIDLCHYDSDKSYEGRAMAYPRLWAHLRPGGVFMSDDIADNTAFRDFSEEVGVVPVVIEAPGAGASGPRYVGLLRKP